MKNEVFGSQDVSKGVHIPSQKEWNDQTGAITNVRIGETDAFPSMVDPSGTEIPYDSFFFPHVGAVEEGAERAVISVDREEDYYPYKDTMAVFTLVRVDTFELTAGKYAFFGVSDRDTSTTAVEFTKPNYIVPEKPEDNADGGIVGYGWDLEATVTDVTFVGAGDETMIVTTKWIPGKVFDDDSQAALYTVDSADEGSFAPGAFKSTNFTDYEDLINDWLTSESLTNIVLEASADIEIYDREVNVPIAIYNWNSAQTKIDRCVQLLFGSSSPGGGGDSAEGGNSNLKDSISGHIENPSEKVYTLELSAPTAGAITLVTTSCASGSADAELQINEIAVNFVTVGTTIDFSTTEATFTPVVGTPSLASTAVFSAGDTITLEITDNTNLSDAVFTVWISRSTQ